MWESEPLRLHSHCRRLAHRLKQRQQRQQQAQPGCQQAVAVVNQQSELPIASPMEFARLSRDQCRHPSAPRKSTQARPRTRSRGMSVIEVVRNVTSAGAAADATDQGRRRPSQTPSTVHNPREPALAMIVPDSASKHCRRSGGVFHSEAADSLPLLQLGRTRASRAARYRCDVSSCIAGANGVNATAACRTLYAARQPCQFVCERACRSRGRSCVDVSGYSWRAGGGGRRPRRRRRQRYRALPADAWTDGAQRRHVFAGRGPGACLLCALPPFRDLRAIPKTEALGMHGWQATLRSSLLKSWTHLFMNKRPLYAKNP